MGTRNQPPEYLVVGTIDLDAWQRGLAGDEQRVRAILWHVADFKEVLALTLTQHCSCPHTNHSGAIVKHDPTALGRVTSRSGR